LLAVTVIVPTVVEFTLIMAMPVAFVIPLAMMPAPARLTFAPLTGRPPLVTLKETPVAIDTVTVAGFALTFKGGIITVTLALPEMVPLAAFTNVAPGADVVKVTDTFPFASVIPDNAEMFPTVALLTVQDILTPGIAAVPFIAVALNTWLAPRPRVADDGETTIEVRTGGTVFTVTPALPEIVPLVAFTKAVPAEDAVNVTVAFPEASVIAFRGVTVPTIELLLVRLMQHFNYSKNIMVKLIENGK